MAGRPRALPAFSGLGTDLQVSSMSWTDELLGAADPGQVYQRHLQHSIAVRDDAAPAPRHAAWRPLVVSYCGGGNLGADLRAAETIRHLRHLAPGCQPRMTVLGKAKAIAFPQFDAVEQLAIDRYLPSFVKDSLVNSDAVIIAEGSLFTSTFCDDLAMFFVAAMAQRRHNGKPAIAFGVETDAMSARLLAFVSENIHGCSIFSRNSASAALMLAHGVAAGVGADPAWSHHAAEADDALVQAHGGHAAYIAVCPVNPFWWPVTLDRQKLAALAASGEHQDTQFSGAYFHCFDQLQRERYEHYVGQYATYIDWCRRRLKKAPVLIAMEGVDSAICRDINARAAHPACAVLAHRHRPQAMAALLGGADFVVSNRFHAAILAMLGQAPCIAISMDGRLQGLYQDMALADMLLPADSSELCSRLQEITLRMLDQLPSLRHRIALGHVRQLRRLAEMGRALVTAVQASDLGTRTLDAGLAWQRYLPALSPAAQRMLADMADRSGE